ncbi:MAG: SemiSWEET transporter [Chloroflexi bacterium]|nr:SemiSWEET transporter [Chloroflexota bacterium]
MALEIKELVGLLAGGLTTISLVPQLMRVFRSRSSRDISLPFTLMLLLGFLFWLMYGLLNGLMPVILWNSLGLVFMSVLLYGKVKFS